MIMYRASAFRINLSNKLKSPEIVCPEDPHNEQSTASLPGSYTYKVVNSKWLMFKFAELHQAVIQNMSLLHL